MAETCTVSSENNGKTSYYYTYDKVLLFNKSENRKWRENGKRPKMWWWVGGGMTSSTRRNSSFLIEISLLYDFIYSILKAKFSKYLEDPTSNIFATYCI